MIKTADHELINRPFLWVAMPPILLVLLSHLFWNETEIFLFLNSSHCSVCDLIFPLITEGGNGYVISGLSLLIIILERKHLNKRFLTLLTSFLIGSLIVVICKNVIWPEAPRPVEVLGRELLQVVDGVALHSWKSFPSGHTATAFSLLFALATPYSKKFQIGIAIVSLLIGYSRIYLNQHFGLDVAVGATIGIASGYLAYLIVRPPLETPILIEDNSRA